jgi:CPA2 family monovalent cation:H+ antiporter-2
MSGDFAQSIQDLGIILGVAALTSLASQRLKQPPVLGYLMAGMLLGPHVPGIVLGGAEESLALTHSLSELGVILLMFSIGIEFSLRKIARIGMAAGLTALIEVGLMISLGYLVGRMFGWSPTESLFVGACMGISSTMLVAKSFESQKLRGGFVDLTFAVLVFEDMIAILLLAVLQAVASGTGLSPGEFAITIGKLFGFLIALLAGGLLIVPRFIRGVVRQDKGETTLIAAVAVCFAMSALAATAGYSVALGAFLAGMLISESGEGHRVEHLIKPLQGHLRGDLLHRGRHVDRPGPGARELAAGAGPDRAGAGRQGLRRVAGGVPGRQRPAQLGARRHEPGADRRVLVHHRGARGEQRRDRQLHLPDRGRRVAADQPDHADLRAPVAAAAAEAFDQRLPPRLQTFVTFYDGWIDQLRSSPPAVSTWTLIRRGILLLLLEAALLLAALAGSRLIHWKVITTLSERFSIAPSIVDMAWIGLTLVVAGIFLLGVVRRAAALARLLAEVVVPARKEGKLDLGSAPRRVFTVALELALSLALGLPLVAISQPFLPYSSGFVVFLLVVAALVYNVWRSVTNLQGHVRAGTELIVEMLAKQSREAGGAGHEHKAGESLVAATTMLPGFPGMSAVHLLPDSPAVGRSLGQLSLRVRAGVAVLAIHRDGPDAVMPLPREVLRAGDTLTLAGTHEATELARDILLKGGVGRESAYLAAR